MFPQSKRTRPSSATPSGKRNRNQLKGMIHEDTLLPVRILDCQEGQTTQYGTGTLRFSFQHLVSEEEFNSTVFENSAPYYIDQKILDAVLPPELEEYELEDLVDRGLFVQVKFRTKNDNTYINVVKVDELDEKHQKVLQKRLAEEAQERDAFAADMQEIEGEMERPIENDDDEFGIDELDDLDDEVDSDEEDADIDLDVDDSEFDEITTIPVKSRRN